MATEIDIAVTTTTYNVSITAEPNEYIVNITTGGSGGVQTVTGTTVDNTDPLNPIVEVPSLTQVLTVGDKAPDAIEGDRTWQPADRLKYWQVLSGIQTLDDTVFPDGSLIEGVIQNYDINATVTFDFDGANCFYLDQNITTLTLNVGDFFQLKHFSGGVWILTVANKSSGAGIESVTGTTVDNTDPLNPIVEVPNITQVLETGNTTVDIGILLTNPPGDFASLNHNQLNVTDGDYTGSLKKNVLQFFNIATGLTTNFLPTGLSLIKSGSESTEVSFETPTALNNILIPNQSGTIEFTTVAATGAVISFATPQIYNSIASPSASNITDNLTGARIGVVQKIYHNAGTTPTFPAGWVRRGTGTYVTSTLNIIYAEWSVGTTVEYWITQ